MGGQCINLQMDNKCLKKVFNCINKEKCKVSKNGMLLQSTK